MATVFACLFIVVAAFVGAGLLTSRRGVPRTVRRLMRAGFVFLGLGVLLGPNVTGVLSRETLDQLEPLLQLSVGWIGLLFGLEMRRPHLARYPRRWFLGALLHGALVVAVMLVFLHRLAPLVTPRLAAQLTPEVWIMLALLGAASAPELGHVFHPPEARDHRLMTFIRFTGGIATLLAVVSFGAISGLTRLHGGGPGDLFAGWPVLPLSLAAAVVLGVLFRLLSAVQQRDAESYLVAAGFVVLCSGTALYLGVSSLLLSLVAGAVIGNLPLGRGRRHLRRVLRRLERPMFLMLFLFAGALLERPPWEVLALALLYVGLRAGAEMLAGFATPAIGGERVPVPLGLGPALLSQGGIALALVVDQRRLLGEMPAEVLLYAVLLAALLRALLRPFRLRRAVAQWEDRR